MPVSELIQFEFVVKVFSRASLNKKNASLVVCCIEKKEFTVIHTPSNADIVSFCH